jgi:hypothetical protein
MMSAYTNHFKKQLEGKKWHYMKYLLLKSKKKLTKV